ncbi:MAG: TIGR00725 family protein, partial [Planctomycetota bacterium]
ALAKAGFAIVTGGLRGVMDAVGRGAAKARGKGNHPPVVGILPSYGFDDGNAHVDIAVPTGLGHARNAIVAAAGEVMICIGGSMGALAEIALARKIGRPVLVFPGSGGTAALAAKAAPSVISVKSVEEAVARVKELLR